MTSQEEIAAHAALFNKPRRPTAASPQIEFELPFRRRCAQSFV